MKHSTTMRTSISFPTDLWRHIESDRKRRGIPDTDEDFSGIARLASKLIDRQLR